MPIIVQKIIDETKLHNVDNIARTKAYLNFYRHYPNIKWAFLASQVSRNAGWNMTDLQTNTYRLLLSKEMSDSLFMTYERANWFIFSDAFPQLLLYHYSVQEREPLFHLLDDLQVSKFMQQEWIRYWNERDEKRLLYALIINEQNLIQRPVIQEPYYKQRVFHSLPYVLQEIVHLNSVLFPTLSGKVYGLYIKKFTNVSRRIEIGKKLGSLLYHPNYYTQFLTFANQVTPTGSRREYEQFIRKGLIDSKELQRLFPIIEHSNPDKEDWSNSVTIQSKWWRDVHVDPTHIGEQFYRKRNFLSKIAKLTTRLGIRKSPHS